MEKPRKSALNVMGGVPQPEQINQDLVGKLKSRKPSTHSVAGLVQGIREGNRTLLSQAITLVESSLKAHQEKAQEVIAECLRTEDNGRQTEDGRLRTAEQNLPSAVRSPQSAGSIRIGITGVPGVGKSTFIEAFGKFLTGRGHKVAVLAIDPSSTRSKGSILGDKTRMEELANDPNAFIRPSPAAGSLGGVARKTRETILLCEAAGFDVIIVETVGVGQSEVAVHGMVDFFLLLMLAGAGDELQGIKRGIIEMADAIAINKADGDNVRRAQLAAAEYRNALHLFPPQESGWSPVVELCSAVTREGIPGVWEIIHRYAEKTKTSAYFYLKRKEQEKHLLHEAIEEALKHRFYSNKEIQALMRRLDQEITDGRITPYQAAAKALSEYFR